MGTRRRCALVRRMEARTCCVWGRALMISELRGREGESSRGLCADSRRNDTADVFWLQTLAHELSEHRQPAPPARRLRANLDLGRIAGED
jgi:hypothetical protein